MKVLSVASLRPSPQDSGVLRDGAEGREDRGGGRAEARLHRGGQFPVDEPRAAGTSALARCRSLSLTLNQN